MVNSIGVKSFACDGNDVIQCYNTIKKGLSYLNKFKTNFFRILYL